MREKLFVGLDVHKRNISVGVAEEGRTGEVRFLGDIENSPIAINGLLKKLAKQDLCSDTAGETARHRRW